MTIFVTLNSFPGLDAQAKFSMTIFVTLNSFQGLDAQASSA